MPFIVDQKEVKKQDEEYQKINATLLDLNEGYKNDPQAQQVIDDLDQQLEEERRRQENEF